ncbi:MAG TPA: M14 family metallopeptidase [Ignavibacteriaceae bacterium]
MNRTTKQPQFSKDWLTLFEKSNQQSSPSYQETISYFNKFEDKTPYAKMFTIGISPQGRELKCLIVAGNEEFTFEKAKKSGKAIVLIQNGIHSGEIEGKDACMLLLRDILVTKEKFNLLKNLVLLIIPVFNVDGHERLSQFNRPNQNGPLMMGWRTTSHNLNLNRDYMKADSVEMKAWLKLFSDWLPDFMIDNHTTNGADYQYHVTYGLERKANISNHLSSWINGRYLPYLIKKVEKDGFLTTRYIEFKNDKLMAGIIDYPMLPRFSTGYCAVQNRICLLVETHSLKPFDNRVFSTKSMMTHTIDFINRNHHELISLNKKADNHTINYHYNKGKVLPVDFEDTGKHASFSFKGFESFEEDSEITGNELLRYTNKPIVVDVPLYNKTRVKFAVNVPKAYLIPKEFSRLAEILNLHGIKCYVLSSSMKMTVDRYKFVNDQFVPRPYEGKQQVTFDVIPFTEKIKVPKGTIVVRTNQRTLRVIANLLEPMAPDSFVRWEFFNSFFERKEYVEVYVMEPIAKQMLKDNQKLRDEFHSKLDSDENFRNDSLERLDFFYRKSPYFDKDEKVYPIMRVNEKILL